jgi:hypothetical protein
VVRTGGRRGILVILGIRGYPPGARWWVTRSVLLCTLAACGGSSGDGDAGGTDAAGQTPAGGWQETDWCADLADLSAVEASYDPGDVRGALVAVSELRYPPAVAFIDAQSDAELAGWFFQGTATFDDVLAGYEVAVHEGCHIWGFDHFSFDSYAYRVVDDDHVIETDFLENFPRSEILDRHPYPTEDFYADTYLTGASGDQGFNTVLDEYNAYAHSLVSRYCTRDSVVGATSARDGILTFKLYVELYLQIAREDHPADYDAIVGDAGQVAAILDIWDRSEHWLEVTADHPELGIDDDFIAGFVYDPANEGEIDRLR